MSETEHHLFYVEWNDAVTDSGWANSNEEHSLHRCKSVGWVIKETRKEIVLAGDTSDPQEGQEGVDVNRRIAIPKAWIVIKRKLKIPTK